MPAYNSARYLRESVTSLLNQTFEDFELIIIDDGSTDDTLALLRELTKSDCRVRIVTQANRGIANSCNAALSLARGEFVARMDADDVSLPERFEKHVAYMREHPDCAVVGSRVMLIDPFGSPLHSPHHDVDHDKILAGLMAGVGWSIVQPAAMMRRSTMLAVGGYRTGIDASEDLDLFLRMGEHGKLANLPEVLLNYRQHPDSANHTRVAEQDANKRRIITDAYSRKGLPLPDGWTPPKRKVIPIQTEVDMWAWSALRKGNVTAARKHAVSLLRMSPFSASSWRLMYCALRGR